MDPEHFLAGVEQDQTLADYLDEIAQEADPVKSRTLTGEFLFVVAAYALYLWARNHLDHQRGLNEAELRQLMEQDIDALMTKDKALTRQKALAHVLAVSKAVAHQPPDDSILNAGLALLKKG